MSEKCRKDKEVKITCRGYRNPISPGKMRTHSVVISTFDNEKGQKPIAKLSGKLEPKDFIHVLIPNEDLQVESVDTITTITTTLPNVAETDPKKTETQDYKTHKVTLYLPVPIPMEKTCHIRVSMPKSLYIVKKTTEMQGFGIFKPAQDNTIAKASPGEQR